MENEVVKEVVKEGLTLDGKFYPKEQVVAEVYQLICQNRSLKLAVLGLGIGCVVLISKLSSKRKQSVGVINVPKKEEKED